MKLIQIVGIGVIALFGITVMAQDAAPVAAPEAAAPVVKSEAVKAAPAAAKKVEHKAQTLCPIEGAKIDKTQYADVEGCRIYTCCKDCIDKVKADPKAAIKKITEKGECCDCVCTKCGCAMAKDASCPADSMKCTKCKAVQKTPAGCAAQDACKDKAKEAAPKAPAAPAPSASEMPAPAAPEAPAK